MNNTSISVAHDEQSQQHLVQAGREIESRSTDDKWDLGRVASVFVTDCKHGSDQQLADLIGSQQQRVNECRRVFEERQSYRSSGKLTWTHLRVSLAWDNGDDCLDWAESTCANVAEMKAWRRAMRGEDLSADTPEPVKAPSQQAPEPNKPITRPQAANRNTGAPSSPPTDSYEMATGRPEAGGTRQATGNTPATSAPVKTTTDLRQAAGEAIKALRQLASEADIKRKRATAGSLRRLADEFDPPSTDIPPRLESVAAYCTEQKNGVSAEAFWDFYQSKGWMVGKQKMRDWQASVRTAERGGYFQGSADASARVRDKTRREPVYRDFPE
jgi:hypothetical protein